MTAESVADTMLPPATTTEELWHILSDDLRGFLRSRLPSDSDADDLLQNVFLRAIEKFNSLRETDRIGSWVYSIARNEIADFYRRRTPQPAESVEEAVRPEDNEDPTANHCVGVWLSSIIDQLPDTLRSAAQMYEIQGFPQADIAARLNISLSGAKSRIQRARRLLEKRLRECCQVELDRRGNVIDCQPIADSCCEPRSCSCSG